LRRIIDLGGFHHRRAEDWLDLTTHTKARYAIPDVTGGLERTIKHVASGAACLG
jgi:hypothetical protein